MLRVTISGDESESRDFILFLREVLKSFDAQLSNVRGPYPNHYEKGKRFHLNINMPRAK